MNVRVKLQKCLHAGKRLTNPVVLCLNILNCRIDEAEQAKIRYQFAVFNADVNYWEYCSVNRTVMELRSTDQLVSIGHRDLSIEGRHLTNKSHASSGELSILVKIQIIQYCESEKHNLSQDMSRLLKHQQAIDTLLICAGDDKTSEKDVTKMPVHRCIIEARSLVLTDMIRAVTDDERKETSDDSGKDYCPENVNGFENNRKEIKLKIMYPKNVTFFFGHRVRLAGDNSSHTILNTGYVQIVNVNKINVQQHSTPTIVTIDKRSLAGSHTYDMPDNSNSTQMQPSRAASWPEAQSSNCNNQAASGVTNEMSSRDMSEDLQTNRGGRTESPESALDITNVTTSRDVSNISLLNQRELSDQTESDTEITFGEEK
ncbi:unnamed protein product [Trichogramma brassicae]|uniref:Uncharacterized protein n=1 Tax=Trichogramma brassicae TaxID=86971 RepID=A0A6H5IU14_9HYME|nr:unnamed protein product [Trichogramma brassicae]